MLRKTEPRVLIKLFLYKKCSKKIIKFSNLAKIEFSICVADKQ